MVTRARAVLMDLDDTLFDHTATTRAALARLGEVDASFRGWPLDELEQRHSVILEELHAEVLAGRRTIDEARVERFFRLLEASPAGAARARAETIASIYREAYLASWTLVRGALPLLEALRAEAVPVVVVTNNGVQEQQMKLTRGGLTTLVASLVTSEEVGASKPDVRIFEHALAQARVRARDAVMFGDAWRTDVDGARAAGIRAVWFNRRAAIAPDPAVRWVDSLEPTQAVLRLLLGPDTG